MWRCPAKFNEHGSHEQFQEYMAYGNHKSLTKNPIAFRKAMNKEDRRDHVLTFPSWVAPFIQHLMLTPNGLVQISEC